MKQTIAHLRQIDAMEKAGGKPARAVFNRGKLDIGQLLKPTTRSEIINNFKNDELSAFLDSLPDEKVIALTVLMYAGRDGDLDMIEAVDRLECIWRDREHSTDAIKGKVNRMKYIDAGLQKISSDSLCIEIEKRGL